MRSVERIISQMSYDRRRKRYLNQSKKQRRRGGEVCNQHETNGVAKPIYTPLMVISFPMLKKIIGIGLIVVGLLLILTKCFGGASKSEASDLPKKQVAYKTSTSYENHIQDFNIAKEDLEELLNLSLRYKQDYAHTLSVWAVESYKGGDIEKVKKSLKYNQSENELDQFAMYDAAVQLYKQFIYDISRFPLKIKKGYHYENGWKQGRTYNGNRLHYGIDIMSDTNRSGEIEIISMTDGVIENIGWNETGGYRVGIRSPGGAYFYYAHLDHYPDHLQKGDAISAGDVIGLMGNTGYGVEGTRGKFPVHLHMGIAVKTKDEVEFWINPYALLQYLEDK